MEENVPNTILEGLNPWWHDASWHARDPDIQAVESSRIKRRLLYWMVNQWLRPILEKKGWAIRVFRGPRRVGKTTLMKLLIREAIRIGYNPKSITYITLDNEDLRHLVKEKGLRKILRHIITESLNQYGYSLVVIDEATFYNEWALALKNLVDEGVARIPGVLVIVTGSYSLELHAAKRELEGRMGIISGDSIGQRFIYPLRFVEVVESLSDDIREYLRRNTFTGKHMLTHVRERLCVLEALAEPGNDKVYRFLEDLWNNIGKLTISYLEEMYLLTGGFPRALHEYSEHGRIDDYNYDAFYNLIVSDAEKFGLEPVILERILRSKMLMPRVEGTLSSFQIEVESFKGGKERASRTLRVEEVKAYLNYLIDGSRILTKMPSLKYVGRHEALGRVLDIDPSKPFKLVFTDPFMFHSVYWVSQGYRKSIVEAVKNLIINARYERKGWPWQLYTSLYESVVCSHVARITLLKYGEETSNYGRVVYKGKEYADCIVWYYDAYMSTTKIIPVEVTVSPQREDIVDRARTVVKLLRRRLIVASSNQLDLLKGSGYEAVIVPAALLLLFI